MIKKLSFAKKYSLLAVAVGVAFLSTSCSTLLDIAKISFQQPKVGINSFSYTGADSQKVKFNLLLNIDNPNAIGIKTSGINYNLDLNNAGVINGNLSKGLEIAANGKNNIEIPIDVNFQNLLQIAPSLISNPNNLDYKVYGTISFDTPIGPIPINWQKQDKVSIQQLLTLPQIFNRSF